VVPENLHGNRIANFMQRGNTPGFVEIHISISNHWLRAEYSKKKACEFIYKNSIL